jgi:diguanylate cyclase (GGDEF)-like protein
MSNQKGSGASAESVERQLAAAQATVRALREVLASRAMVYEAFECDDAVRIIVDQDDRIVVCNRMAEQVFGESVGESVRSRVFECVRRLHGRRRSEQSVVQEIPVSYGLELLARLRQGQLGRIRERVVIDSRMKGLIGAILSVVPIEHEDKRWLKIEVNEVDSIEDDNLTRLGTKEQLERKVAEAIRSGKPFSLLYYDIDSFKRVNDTYGHADGDDVIAGVAQRTSHCARRSTDFPARVHGDEFCVLVLDNALAACGLGERIRAEIEGSLFATRSGRELRVTVSMGVAEYESGDTVDSVLKRADMSMFASKKEGRNRVTRNMRGLSRS